MDVLLISIKVSPIQPGKADDLMIVEERSVRYALHFVFRCKQADGRGTSGRASTTRARDRDEL